MLIGIPLILVGGALIETPIVGYMNGEWGWAQIIAGLVFGSLFLVPGVMFTVWDISDRIKQPNDPYMKELLEALSPGFKEAVGKTPLDGMLVSFRKHYTQLFGKGHSIENEPIQQEVTQIFRNILQLQKNRLVRLGLTCEMELRRMGYTKADGLYTHSYSDGKYGIIDVREEVAAQTIYKKYGKVIHTKRDKDTANYTIIEAKQVGEDTLICPNCGAATTRENLLDGCDYCGTKFRVEDLGSRIAAFAFRPDEKLRYEKYLRTRNRTIAMAVIAFVVGVFLFFTALAVVMFPDLLVTADGGIILTLMSSLFAIVISAPVYILSLLVVYGGYVLPVAALLGFISWRITKKVRARKDTPMLDRQREEEFRRDDPNFSMANFYSGAQNKLFSVIFADTPAQLNAFAVGDLSRLLGRYSDVVGVDVEQMRASGLRREGQYLHARVDTDLWLTRYDGKKCRTKKERLWVKLVKAADSKTQVVCAPAVLTCKGCGSSLDLLQGKRCLSCGRELDLAQTDWVIEDIGWK